MDRCNFIFDGWIWRFERQEHDDFSGLSVPVTERGGQLVLCFRC